LDLNSIIAELKTERDRIGRAVAALLEEAKVVVSGRRKPGRPGRRPGGITAAGRRRLSEAMKRRWAERRRSEKVAAKTAGRKPRRGLTAAGRKKLSDAMKKRWAEKKKKA